MRVGAAWSVVLFALSTPSLSEPTSEDVILPSGTTIDFEIVDHVNSKISKIGDTFAFRVIQPVYQSSRLLIPAGTIGRGEVIHAARARAGGKGGELIITARYVDVAGQKIPLRAFRFGKSGENNTSTAMVVAIAAGPLAYLVVGGEVDVPPGTTGNAKTSADVTITPAPAAAAGN